MEGLGCQDSDNEIDEELTKKDAKLDDVQSRESSRGALLQPLYILEKAFQKVNAPGSSTVLVAILNKDYLHLVNLGDSGFVHYRQ